MAAKLALEQSSNAGTTFIVCKRDEEGETGMERKTGCVCVRGREGASVRLRACAHVAP